MDLPDFAPSGLVSAAMRAPTPPKARGDGGGVESRSSGSWLAAAAFGLDGKRSSHEENRLDGRADPLLCREFQGMRLMECVRSGNST